MQIKLGISLSVNHCFCFVLCSVWMHMCVREHTCGGQLAPQTFTYWEQNQQNPILLAPNINHPLPLAFTVSHPQKRWLWDCTHNSAVKNVPRLSPAPESHPWGPALSKRTWTDKEEMVILQPKMHCPILRCSWEEHSILRKTFLFLGIKFVAQSPLYINMNPLHCWTV